MNIEKETKENRKPRATWIYIVFWISISCSMILFNKAVLSEMNFAFPMFLTTWHMTLATVLTQIMARTTDMLPSVSEGKVTKEDFKRKIIPIAVLFSVSLILSNKAYIYLSVSYIQMLKAFTPCCVLAFSYIAGLEASSHIEVYIVLVICLGVAMTSVGETFFSMTGFIYQTCGIMAESSRLVCLNILMKDLKLDPLSNLYYIAPCCATLIGVSCFIFEYDSLPFDRMMSQDFVVIMLLNGAVAFALNVAVVLLIGKTSALVLTLAGVIKDILLVILSMTIFGSPVTGLQYIGYGIALVGLNLHKEYKKDPQEMSKWLTGVVTCNGKL